MIYRFRFWDKVISQIQKSRGDIKPSKEHDTVDEIILTNETNEYNSHTGNEGFGRFIAFAETVGHPLTYKILTDGTKKVCTKQR